MTRPLILAVVLILGCAAALPFAQAPAVSPVNVVKAQKNVYMLHTATSNLAVQVGDDGLLLVDTGDGPLSSAVIAAIRTLSTKPVHTIVNTHLHPDHTGGNVPFSKLRGVQAVRVMAHESTFNRMMDEAAAANSNVPQSALPMNTYFTPNRDFFLNGEAVVLHHAPAAHTDGDTIVHFRSSDVVAVGDLFTPGGYPLIDMRNGGTVDGLLAGLNKILEITVPARYQEGGTYVIPGHGRLSDEADVVEFRDMVTIVRDRVQDLMKKKQTLAQIKAARPSRDYDGDYDAGRPADEFVESIYRSLGGK
jgi:cyclase